MGIVIPYAHSVVYLAYLHRDIINITILLMRLTYFHPVSYFIVCISAVTTGFPKPAVVNSMSYADNISRRSLQSAGTSSITYSVPMG